MSRFFELAVRVRRLVARTAHPSRAPRGTRLTARRQLGGDLTQFSFRVAFMIDLTYVGIGALGGAAVGRATTATTPAAAQSPLQCTVQPTSTSERRTVPPNGTLGPVAPAVGVGVDRLLPGVSR